MGFKEQLNKIKENWLLIALVLILLLVVSGAGSLTRIGTASMSKSMELSDGAYAQSAGRYASGYYPAPEEDFAPGVTERILTKSASLSTQVERGTFESAASKLKSITTTSNSITLNENVNKYGKPGKEYLQGSYQIKVPVKKYDAVVAELKGIGKVQSFNENTQDITGESIDLDTELAAEKARLSRYEQMLKDATIIQDKITLSDKIFDQERRVAYLEDRTSGMDERVDYATVSLNINEKPSEYMDVAIAKFSALWRTLVDSMNALLYFVFAVFPWAVAAGIIMLVWKLFKRKND